MTAGSVEIAPAVSDADRAAVRAIRQAVFVEEQRCPPDEEWDDDALTGPVHWLVARQGGAVVGCARWRPLPEAASGEAGEAKLERFAVLPVARGTGLGRALVARAVADATAAGHRRLVLHAQAHLAGFYASFGFDAVGEPFVEAGIEHVKMERTAG